MKMRSNFKKILLISIFSVFITGICGLVNGNFKFPISNFQSNSNDQNLKLEELKIKEVEGNKYAFKTKDDSMIEIGTDKESKPYLALEKWDEEVSLRVGIPYEVAGKPMAIGDKIVYSTPDNRILAGNWWQKLFSKFFVFADNDQSKIEIAFYPREPEEITETVNGKVQIFTQNEYGGVEFDTILYEKPNTNQIIFPIETKGLKFYYQPPLTQQEIDEGVFRPENVVGSYAVYHESKSGDYTALGGKNYRAGKAFHIYRPRIYDAAGNEVWGELKIDEQNNSLAITIPQEFLDKTVYPVTVDPTFGRTDVGVTWGGWGENYWRGIKAAPSLNGNADSISVYTSTGDSGYFKGVLTDLSLNILVNGIGNGIAAPLDGSPGWATSTFSISPSLAGGTNYYVGGIVNPNIRVYYDAQAVDSNKKRDVSNDYTSPSSPTDATDSSVYVSIYATYTAEGGYEMASTNYRIWASSINAGGHSQTSTSYRMRDTIGEFVAGTATSTSYKLRMGYQPMLESYISLAVSTTSVQMLPNIGGVTGGIATGSFSATVITDNPAGYSLFLNASTTPAMKSGSYSFTDYTIATANTPDYTWSIVATTSEFGFSAEGIDITQAFKDNGSSCAAGTQDTADKCWYNFATTTQSVAIRYSSNHLSGTQTTIKLQAQAGSSRMQEEGTYQAIITTTAIAN